MKNEATSVAAKTLKSNSSAKRQRSLFRQGLYWYPAMPTTRPEWFERLLTAFDRIVAEQA